MKCSPQVWKKFNFTQRQQWLAFYERFLVAENYPPEWSGMTQHKKREVTAHNLACQAVWALEVKS